MILPRPIATAVALLASMSCRAELAPESIPNVLTLPAEYPDTWVFAHDTNFFSLVDGKVVILDVAAETRNYKGQIPAGQFGSFLEATERSELYVAETYHSRRVAGERTDVITVYDKSTLDVVDEVVLPGGKRAQVVTHKNTLQLTDGERLLLVYNFTPAESVTVVDIAAREVLNEIEIPGCALIYPTGRRGFSSLCGDGALQTVVLDQRGRVASRKRRQPFFDVDGDPLFAKPVTIDGISYFPSFRGKVQPIDFRADEPEILPAWSLTEGVPADRNWRPGGWQIAAGRAGRLYVLMHPDGFDGSHKSGGAEIWVFDVAGQRRLARFPLENWGVSLEVTQGSAAYLVVMNGNLEIEVLEAATGKSLRTIGDRAAETPFLFHAVKP